MKKLIGLSGKLGSGKSTVAKMLQAAFPQDNIIIESFAKPLKEEVAKMLEQQEVNDSVEKYRYSDEILRDINTNKQYYRKLLQWWGTDYRRRQNPFYWINLLAQRVVLLPKDSVVIIDDIRFRNEAEWVLFNHDAYDKELWRIGSYQSCIAVETHESETELDSSTLLTHIVLNSGGITELEQKVIELYD